MNPRGDIMVNPGKGLGGRNMVLPSNKDVYMIFNNSLLYAIPQKSSMYMVVIDTYIINQ